MGISVDGTFAIQIVSFLILWVVLRRILFDPMLKVLDERQSRTSGSLEMASHIRSDVESLRAEHADRVAQARDRSMRQLEESRKLTTEEERTVLGAARAQATARLATTRVEISEQVARARATLERDTATLATQLVEKVVGRPVV